MPIYQVDAFTDTPYFGNPTAVVVDEPSFNKHHKQIFAREMNLSVTTFVSKSEKADFKVEFYTPESEIPLSGHGTIATFWALAKLGKIKPAKNYAKVTQETKAGIVTVELYWKNKKLDKVFMTQQPPTFTETDLEKKYLADILGIRTDKIESNEKLPMVIVSTGSPKLFVLMSSKEMTDALVPNFDDLVRLCRKLKVTGVHLFSFDTYLEGSTCYSRHFVPIAGVQETPVSALANGALGALLVKYNFTPPGSFTIEQGESLDRPGIVEIQIGADEDGINSVKVGGKAEMVMKLELLLDT